MRRHGNVKLKNNNNNKKQTKNQNQNQKTFIRYIYSKVKVITQTCIVLQIQSITVLDATKFIIRAL